MWITAGCRRTAARSIQRGLIIAAQHSCLSSVAQVSGTDDEKIMGMAGTSVTRKLWQDRLTKNKERLQHLPLSAPSPRPPHTISVTYPLNTDRFLQEQVSGKATFISNSKSWCSNREFLLVSIGIRGDKCGLESFWRTWTLWLAT